MDTFALKFAARAVRAYANATNPDLPTMQKRFHMGRYESYLQTVAVYMGIPVADVRAALMSSHESR